jgi:hypothetical protein
MINGAEYLHAEDQLAAPCSPCLSVADWLERELPEPDFLLGEWLSTTDRALLVADTGLGKTHLGLAVATAVSLGRGFLHWSGRPKPARVLYIDGEMSRRLMKIRLKDVVRRAGDTPKALFVLSREDFPTLDPLNTQPGQDFIDQKIDELGGIDLVVFDNIMSLLTGDMAEAEPWQQTLPWIYSLTRRSVGQLWIHHTGYNTSHGYGTKTREWHLESVALMTKAERANADIAFALEFTKARNRTPSNRADFASVTITMTDDEWSVEGATAKPGKPPSPLAQKYHAALQDACVVGGAVRPQTAGRQAVSEGEWKAECAGLRLLDTAEGKGDTDRALFSKYRRELIAANWITCNGDLAWSMRP